MFKARLKQPHSISEKTEKNDSDHDHRNRATDKIVFQRGNGRWYGYDRRSASSDAYVVRSMNDGETLSKLGNTNLPIRGCRIRLCIFASTTWPDIYRLLRTTISASLKIKVNGARHIEIDESLLDRQDLRSPVAASQSRAVDAELLEYIKSLQSYEPTITHQHGAESEVKEAAIEGLQRYSVGPGSARWFWGTFDIFVALEQRLGKLYPSVNKQSGKTKGRLESRSIFYLNTLLTTYRHDLVRHRAWDRHKHSGKCGPACVIKDEALGLYRFSSDEERHRWRQDAQIQQARPDLLLRQCLPSP